jgi:glycosyltransferase involved in cell wall biosynthesis
MKIGFDISQTGALKAGCGHYAHSIVEHLTAADRRNEYILYPAFGTRFWDPQHTTATYRTARPNVRRGPEGMSHAECVALWQCGGHALDRALGAPDIVHANNYYCPRHLRARVVFTLYDLVSLDQPEYLTEANRLVCADGLLDACVHADMLVAISEATRTRFLELFPHYPASRVRTIYPGSRFHLPAAIGRLPDGLIPSGFWLAVGTLEPRKNLRRLVRAFARLVQACPEMPPLVIAGGDGWLEEDFDALLAELGIAARVRRLGYVDDPTLAALYTGCLAFVYPSLVEGFGLPVLEAMSLGAAVITSDRSSLPEIVGAAGLLVNPEDERAIEAAMARLMTDASLRDRLRELGRHRAKGFSWSAAARAVLELYEEVRRRPPLAEGAPDGV